MDLQLIYHFQCTIISVKMPKQKGRCASQTKRHKQIQRQDLVKLHSRKKAPPTSAGLTQPVAKVII